MSHSIERAQLVVSGLSRALTRDTTRASVRLAAPSDQPNWLGAQKTTTPPTMPAPATSSHAPPSPDLQHPSKRMRQSSPGPDKDSPASLSLSAGANSPLATPTHEHPPSAAGGLDGSAKVGQSSSFRNVSACNRCRLRKNRCDQKLPSCASCEKAGVPCVGYDPITKREIPRSR